MPDTEYVKGRPEDRDEIVDFANYVFSQAHEPHDFRRLLPKTYDPSVKGIEDWHYLARQQGRIVGLVAVRPETLRVFDRTLRMGFIGTVSVHPYHRGEGHMKKLMAMAVEDSARRGHELLILGGRRQRYNYYGFEQAGVAMYFVLTGDNVRHALADADAGGVSFAAVTEADTDALDEVFRMSESLPVRAERPREELLMRMRSWQSDLHLIRVDGRAAGYCAGMGMELTLRDEKDLPRVLKALYALNGKRDLHLSCSLFEKERAEYLSAVAESTSVGTVEMIRPLRWETVLQTYLEAQARVRPLADGTRAFAPDGCAPFTVSVRGGVPLVTPGAEGEVWRGSGIALCRLFFGLSALALPGGLPDGWAPLPFYMTGVDTF